MIEVLKIPVQTINSLTRVLLLENKHKNSKSIEPFLRVITEDKYKFYTASLVSTDWNILQRNPIDVILINIDFKKTSWVHLQQQIYTASPKIPIIFITANLEEQKLIQEQSLDVFSEDTGTQSYILKKQLSILTLENLIDSSLNKDLILERLQQTQNINLKLRSQLKYTQELFKTVVDSTSTLMWTIDREENYTFVNQAWLSFTGQSLSQGLSENWRDRIHPQDLAECDRAYQDALNKCQGFQIEYRLKRFDNTYRTILNTAVRRYNEHGDFAGLLCSCLDITQRKKIERQAIYQAQTDRILADITQNIHSSLNLDLILQTAAEQVANYLLVDKVSINKIIDRHQLYLLFESGENNLHSCCEFPITKDKYNKLLANCYKRLAEGEIITSEHTSLGNLTVRDVNFSDISYPLLAIPIIVDQKLWGIIFVEQTLPPRCWRSDEINLLERIKIQLGIAIKQSELYQELERLAVIDGLTKIANRRKFDHYLAAEWKRLAREQKSLSLILCDVDLFKLYNDTYGHQQGDRCLQQVAKAITKVTKRPADLAARYGGEEFAIVLPNTDLQGAKYLAQQVRLQLESLKIPHINSSVDLYVTLSIGISSCIPDRQLSCHALIESADKGLYEAKELGRNQIVESAIS